MNVKKYLNNGRKGANKKLPAVAKSNGGGIIRVLTSITIPSYFLASIQLTV